MEGISPCPGLVRPSWGGCIYRWVSGKSLWLGVGGWRRGAGAGDTSLLLGPNQRRGVLVQRRWPRLGARARANQFWA